MPSKIKTCEDYRKGLMEATAQDSEPSRKLRSHLDDCPSCRAALTEETQLFAAIDAGVRSTANAEVPVSLLPRVRKSLEAETVAKHGWLTNRMLLAGAAAVVLSAPVLLSVWRHGSGAGAEPTKSTAKQAAPPLPTLKYQIPPLEPIRGDHSRASIAVHRAPSRTRAGNENSQEVLVPRDQEAILISYAAEWSRRKRAPLAADDVGEAVVKPLEVSPIQIAQLDVKLLAEEKSQ